jgi:hypothetical protein
MLVNDSPQLPYMAIKSNGKESNLYKHLKLAKFQFWWQPTLQVVVLMLKI